MPFAFVHSQCFSVYIFDILLYLFTILCFYNSFVCPSILIAYLCPTLPYVSITVLRFNQLSRFFSLCLSVFIANQCCPFNLRFCFSFCLMNVSFQIRAQVFRKDLSIFLNFRRYKPVPNRFKPVPIHGQKGSLVSIENFLFWCSTSALHNC